MKSSLTFQDMSKSPCPTLHSVGGQKVGSARSGFRPRANVKDPKCSGLSSKGADRSFFIRGTQNRWGVLYILCFCVILRTGKTWYGAKGVAYQSEVYNRRSEDFGIKLSLKSSLESSWKQIRSFIFWFWRSWKKKSLAKNLFSKKK